MAKNDMKLCAIEPDLTWRKVNNRMLKLGVQQK